MERNALVADKPFNESIPNCLLLLLRNKPTTDRTDLGRIRRKVCISPHACGSFNVDFRLAVVGGFNHAGSVVQQRGEVGYGILRVVTE